MSVPEWALDPGQLAGGLHDGAAQVSRDQEICFQRYSRTVLPLDGWVFWTRENVERRVHGSLHYGVTLQQSADDTAATAQVIFTARERVDEFDAAPVNTIFVAQVGDLRYAFSSFDNRFHQAGLWHYTGQSIPPAKASQLIDLPGQIDPTQAVATNSLPLWIALNSWKPLSPDAIQSAGVTLYPAYMVPTNLGTPYGVIEIDPNTEALQATAYRDAAGNYWQLVKDTVRITLYGLQAPAVFDFVRFVNQYSASQQQVQLAGGYALMGPFGLMNSPVPSDVPRALAEIQTLAMKKVIAYEISYYQARARQVAQQLIVTAQASVVINIP